MISVRQNALNTIIIVLMAHFRCTIPPYRTASAGMLIKPTSVAAVSCQALSPELSQCGYGFTLRPSIGHERRVLDSRATLTSRVSPPLRYQSIPSMSLIGEFRERFPSVTSVERFITTVLHGDLIGRLLDVEPDAAADPGTDPLHQLRPGTRL